MSSKKVQNKKAKKRSGYKKVSKAIKTEVQKQINKNTEDKIATAQYQYTPYNSAISQSGDAVGIMPIINQGSQNAARIGDDIRVKALNIYGWITLKSVPLTTSVAYQPAQRIAVCVIVCQPKTVSGRTDISNNQGAWMSRLLKLGNTSVAYDGTLLNSSLPLNTDTITKYYDKTFYMSQDAFYSNGISTEGTISAGATSVKKIHIKFPIKSKAGRLVKYDQSYDASYPTDFNPVILLGYTFLDNSSPDTTSTNVTLQFTSVCHYQDS